MSNPTANRLHNALRACRSSLFAVGFFSLFVNLLMLTPPFYMLQVYGRVVTSGSVPTLVMLTIIMAVLMITMGLLDWTRSRIMVRISTKQVAVQALVDAKVLMPWPDTFKAQLGLQLEGLHCVNEAALAQLPEADFLVLRQKQALGIAYALNLSLQQGHLLLRLQKHNPAVDTPADVDALFGNKGGDDTIHFGF